MYLLLLNDINPLVQSVTITIHCSTDQVIYVMSVIVIWPYEIYPSLNLNIDLFHTYLYLLYV